MEVQINKDMKILNKIKKYFYSSFLGDWYFSFLLWLDKINNKDKIPLDLTTTKIVIQAEKMAYARGIKKIKTKIKELTACKNIEEQEKVLQELQDLMVLAEETGDSKKRRQEVLKAMYVRNGHDLKNDTEKAKMMRDRIEDMKKYREAKEFRDLTRALRKARQENDKDLIEELEEKWNELRKRRYPRNT